MVTEVAKETKLWGVTQVVHRDQVSEVCHASIAAGGYSSRHRHLHKDNTFYVLRGVLLVKTFTNREGDPFVTVTLTAGQACKVPCRMWHKFEATTAVELIEIYSIGLAADDIERDDVGGRANG